MIPSLTLAITLLDKNDEWWDITALTWFTCVFIYYIFFASICIFFEINGALELIRFHPKLSDVYRDIDTDGETLTLRTKHILVALKTAILLRQRQVLSGYKTVSFIEKQTKRRLTTSIIDCGAREHMKKVRFSGFWALVTEFLCCTYKTFYQS